MRLSEGTLEVCLENLTGILQIFLGIGLGSGDALEGFVEDGDDSALRTNIDWESDSIVTGQFRS